jgi:hypothetical protein
MNPRDGCSSKTSQNRGLDRCFEVENRPLNGRQQIDGPGGRMVRLRFHVDAGLVFMNFRLRKMRMNERRVIASSSPWT